MNIQELTDKKAALIVERNKLMDSVWRYWFQKAKLAEIDAQLDKIEEQITLMHQSECDHEFIPLKDYIICFKCHLRFYISTVDCHLSESSVYASGSGYLNCGSIIAVGGTGGTIDTYEKNQQDFPTINE